jgi:hypothetical protein
MLGPPFEGILDGGGGGVNQEVGEAVRSPGHFATNEVRRKLGLRHNMQPQHELRLAGQITQR